MLAIPNFSVYFSVNLSVKFNSSDPKTLSNKKLSVQNLTLRWNWPIKEAKIGHLTYLIGQIPAYSQILL